MIKNIKILYALNHAQDSNLTVAMFVQKSVVRIVATARRLLGER
jgi:hypothetical protein